MKKAEDFNYRAPDLLAKAVRLSQEERIFSEIFLEAIEDELSLCNSVRETSDRTVKQDQASRSSIQEKAYANQ